MHSARQWEAHRNDRGRPDPFANSTGITAVIDPHLGLLYEIKLGGYRAVAFKSGGKVHLRSRNDNDFGARYPAIAKALQAMPDESVIDGEIVALAEAAIAPFSTHRILAVQAAFHPTIQS